MHTVERLERAVALAGQLGFRVRAEWLGGDGGGDCEIKGERWIFLDLADSPAEQLRCVLAAVEGHPAGAPRADGEPRKKSA